MLSYSRLPRRRTAHHGVPREDAGTHRRQKTHNCSDAPRGPVGGGRQTGSASSALASLKVSDRFQAEQLLFGVWGQAQG